MVCGIARARASSLSRSSWAYPPTGLREELARCKNGKIPQGVGLAQGPRATPMGPVLRWARILLYSSFTVRSTHAIDQWPCIVSALADGSLKKRYRSPVPVPVPGTSSPISRGSNNNNNQIAIHIIGAREDFCTC